MWRRALLLGIGCLAVGLLIPQPAEAQRSKASRIASAMAAAPASISRDATIKDWPGKDGKMAVLREGTNGWVCLPSNPPTQYKKNDAMCIDPEWQEWLASAFENRAPKITKVGYAYMLTANEWGSNTDPLGAKGPTPDNQWHKQGPHLMVLYPDPKMLEGIPARPSKMGPYVMMPGSHHAHVMWPVK